MKTDYDYTQPGDTYPAERYRPGDLRALSRGMKRFFIMLDRAGERHGFVIDDEPAVLSIPGGDLIEFLPGAEAPGLPSRAAPVFGSRSSGSPSLTLIGEFVREWWLRRNSVPIQSVDVYWWWGDPSAGRLFANDEVFRGRIRSPKWKLGDGFGELSFSVAPAEELGNIRFPPNVIGDEGRFPDAPEDSRGMACPIIYGTVRGLPLYRVTATRWILAGHAVADSEVEVMNGEESLGSKSVSTSRDGLGGLYSYVTLPSGTEGYLYAVEVTGPSDDRVGAVLEHLVRTYGGPIINRLDLNQIIAARTDLNRMRCGFYVNEPVTDGSLLQLIKSRFEDQFPLQTTAFNGRQGWTPLLLPPPGEAKPAASIVYGHSAHERGEVTELDADDVVAVVEAAYKVDGYAQGPTESIRVVSRAAVSRWGSTKIDRLDLPDVADSATARLIADNALRVRGKARWRIEYQQADAVLFDLPLLSLIEVTDLEIGLEDARFFLEAVRPREDGSCDVVLISE